MSFETEAGAGSWAAAAQAGAELAGEALAETDPGEWIKETGAEMAAGASIGATAGLACGPLAPICSAVGAIVGALAALGVAIADLFKDQPGTKRCLVDDLGGPVNRYCYDFLGEEVEGAWTVEPNSWERSLSFPIGKNRIPMGQIVWTLRRIKEDHLGINEIWRLQEAIGLAPTVGNLPKKSDIEARAVEISRSFPGPMPAAVREQAGRFAAYVQAGASLPQVYQALGRPFTGPPAARYQRTKNLLAATYPTIALHREPNMSDTVQTVRATDRGLARAMLALRGVAPAQLSQSDTRSGTATVTATDTTKIATYAGIGALAGGLLGRILGGSWTGAAIGAGVGGVAGGGAAYAMKP